MVQENFPKGRDYKLVVQEVEDEVLIFDLNLNKAYCLNKTSAAIWNLCNGKSSVSDITEQLSKKLNQPIPDQFVWLALDQFKKDGLLSNGQEIEIDFDGLSRRQVIRKIAFTSMIALPMIASVVAPNAAMAASGAGCLAPGTFDTVCYPSSEFDCSSFEAMCCSGATDLMIGCGMTPPFYTPPPGITIQCVCAKDK